MAHFGKGGGQMEAYYVYGTPIHCGLQLEWWDLVNLKMPWTTLGGGTKGMVMDVA